jgi:hypothetical protein
MNSKILFSIIFLTFLISFTSAVTIDVDYADFSTSKTINNGQSIDIYVDGGSMNPSTLIIVKLNSNVIYQESVLSQEISQVYLITPSIYSNTAGTYIIEVTAKDGIESKTKTLSLMVTPDITAPVITILGDNPYSMTVGETYTEAGATATDNLDGNISSRITIDSSDLDTETIGEYSVNYIVSDNAGNSKTATRTIRVLASGSDITNPTIVIASPLEGITYNNVDSLIFTATDANLNSCEYSLNGGARVSVSCTSNVLTTISSLTAVTGLNTWVVYATDDAGNEGSSSVSFTVDPSIEDTIPPVITLLGNNPQSITIGRAYVELGATALDNLEGDLTIQITIDSSNVDTSTLGTYQVTYSVSDSTGNTATTTRTINVIRRNSGGGNGNSMPRIDSISNHKVIEGKSYSHRVKAYDNDGDDLTYTIDGPSWLSISSSGLIHGIAPSVISNKEYYIVVTVSDGEDTNSETYTLTVEAKDESSIRDYNSGKGYVGNVVKGDNKIKPIKISDSLYVLFYTLLSTVIMGIIVTSYGLMGVTARNKQEKRQ